MFVEMTTHNLVGRRALKHLQLLSSKGLLRPCLCDISQTLDERESALSFPLSTTRCFFRRGVISSTEVPGEAVLVILVPGVVGVTETPFSTRRIALAPRLEKDLFFLALILAYIPWLNIIVIPAKGKHLFKKKKNKKKDNTTVTSQMNTYSSSPQCQLYARRRQRVQGQGSAGLKCEDQQGRRNHQ